MIVVPIIIEALVMIKKDTDKHINKIPASSCLQEIKKIGRRRTSYLLKSVLSLKRKYTQYTC